MKQLETKRLVIRDFLAEDVARAHLLFSDRETMRWLGMLPEMKTLSETEELVNEWIGDCEEKRYAVVDKVTGEFIGYVAVSPDSEEDREDTRELGFATCIDCRGKGYMKEALTAVLQELKEDGIAYVWACCFKGNDASEMLIKALNFELQQEGKYTPANDKEYVSLEYRITL